MNDYNEPDLSQEQMVQDLTEFEFNFIDFATVVAMARGVSGTATGPRVTTSYAKHTHKYLDRRITDEMQGM